MSLITAFLLPYWQQILGGLAAILGVLGIYAKGRADQKQKAMINDLTRANDIRKAGADARAQSATGKLRDDDGFRRG